MHNTMASCGRRHKNKRKNTFIFKMIKVIKLFQGEDPFGFGGEPFGHPGMKSRGSQQCHTVTKKVGNMVTTYTQCS